MKKFLKHFTSVIITLLLISIGISKLNFWVRPTDTDGAYHQIDTFHNLPQNSIEVIAYGSSHTLRGLSTQKLYESYGIGAYNYSYHWQKINTTRTFIEDSLLTQTPKLILIETFLAGSVLENTNITAEIYYTRYLNNKSSVNNYLKQCFLNDKERYLSYYMPLCAFHDNWNNLTSQSFIPLENEGFYLKTMGFSPSDTVCPITLYDPSTFNELELQENALDELDKIVYLCKKNNIDILFFTVPYEGEYSHGDAIQKYAETNGYTYLNLFEHIDEVGINPKTDFSDIGHLNTSGAEKVSDYLGKYIVKHYELTDMRKIPNNLWEINLP